MALVHRPPSPMWLQFIPKFFTVLRNGYGWSAFGRDSIAGLTVAIVALPLAMALAIASGTTPDKGLITAVVAGFLISALGGSRVQIGGPTGAFVVVVFNVITQHGYDGLVQATLMAGIMLLAAGAARFGTIIKFMPQPVVTGFTSGIALIIFSSQIKDFFGLAIEKIPANFLPKWTTYIEHWSTFSPSTLAVAVGSFALILLLRRYAPKMPAFLFAVLGGSLAAWLFALPVDTIGSRFGDLPNTLPMPHLPSLSFDRMKELLPSAFTIAFLAGIESLLSAVVADGATGFRHRSNGELVAQGIANMASACFGGLPATGAIARTMTNIRSGGKTPVAGMMHAVFLLAFMYFLAPLARYVPLASLAAILIMVAWNMSEVERFRHLFRAPRGDRIVLLLTFGLTALVDLTVAIEVGMVLAAIMFMYRMSQAVEIETGRDRDMRADLPQNVELFHFRGPFFFGAVTQLGDVVAEIEGQPRVYILDLFEVPLIDASGASALDEFVARCRRHDTKVVICGLQTQPCAIFKKMHLLGRSDNVHVTENYTDAVKLAEKLAC